MDEVDYSRKTAAELLEILRRIHPHRHRENFANLKATLEARGYVVTVTNFGWPVAAAGPDMAHRSLQVPIRFSTGRGPVAWMEPARNDYRLVGAGTVTVDPATVAITGRRLGWILGLPLTRRMELDRERITNVEIIGEAVRFEYRDPAGDSKALTLRCEDASIATRLVELLPSIRKDRFEPMLPAEVEFDRKLLAAVPDVPITVGILALNLLIFVATLIEGAELFSPTGAIQIAWGSNFGPYTTDGDWWRLWTSTFIHFGALHLLFNVWFLAATGPLVERLFGSAAFFVLYSVCGVVASLISISWHPAANSAGASGAILGLYGAFLAALVRGRHSIPPSVVAPLRSYIVAFSVYVVIAGYLMNGVDNAAHVGGLSAGFLLGLVLARRLTIAPTHASGASTVLAGAGVTAGLLCVGVLLASRATSSLEGEGLFWHTQHWLARNELVALDHWNTICDLHRRKKLSESQYANDVESEVLSIWQEAERRLQTVELPDGSPTSARLQYLRAFTSSRRAAYELCVKGAREHNANAFQGCADELSRGDRMAKERS